MAKTSFRGLERVISLLRTLGQIVNVRLPLNGHLTLPQLSRVDEGRLRPTPIPIRSRRWRP
jgi:hypothetical protein